jgi:peptide/nickel transport system permease protein
MIAYLAKRTLSAVLLMLAVSFVAFLLIFAAGDPATRLAGEGGSAADAARIRLEYGFDRPLPLQYWAWLKAFLHGDFGRSFYFDQPVSGVLLPALGITLTLGGCAIVFALALAVPLGIAAGRRPNSWIDRLCLLVAVVGQAMPTFWFALVLVVVFSVVLPVLPSSGLGSWQAYVMPTVALGYFASPAIMRLTRSGVISVLETDYIRTARAMGIAPRRVLLKYALRNAILPVVGISAAQLGTMLAGSVVVESVFAIPGAGRLAWESILRSDLPTVQALVLCFALIYVVLTLLADLLSAWLDPLARE